MRIDSGCDVGRLVGRFVSVKSESNRNSRAEKWGLCDCTPDSNCTPPRACTSQLEGIEAAPSMKIKELLMKIPEHLIISASIKETQKMFDEN